MDKVNQLNTYLESLDETMVNSDIVENVRIFSLMLKKTHLIIDQNITMNSSKTQVIGGLIRNVSKVGENRRNYRKSKRHYYRLRSDNNKKVLSDALKAYERTIKLQQKNYK